MEKRFIILKCQKTRDALCIFYYSTVFDIFTNSTAAFEPYPAKMKVIVSIGLCDAIQCVRIYLSCHLSVALCSYGSLWQLSCLTWFQPSATWGLCGQKESWERHILGTNPSPNVLTSSLVTEQITCVHCRVIALSSNYECRCNGVRWV